MVSDAELAIAAASGDRDALADIYDRYANALFEICRVILGDPHEAADALHDTFVIATTRLEGLREPERLKPWLCAIARHESMRRSSRRVRARPSQNEVLDVPVSDTAERGLIADEAAALVWEAAESLTERERAVLVLNVRRGLDGAELAAAAGLPGPTTSVLLSRAKTQLASAVRCTLLIRGGRDKCVELAALVPRKHAALDALTRKRVARHASSCPTCATTWNATPEALGVLAAAPLVGAPVALRHKVLHDPRLISFSAPLGAGEWQRDGFPPPEEKPRRRVAAGLVAAVAAIAIALVAVLAADDNTTHLAAPRHHPATNLEGEDFEPWPTSPPGENTTTTRKSATTTSSKKNITTTTRHPGAVTPTTEPPAEEPTTTTIPPLTISASARDNTLTCGTGTSAITATTSEPVGALFLNWTAKDESGGKGMNGGGKSWNGTLGPFSSSDRTKTITWWVSTQPFGGTSSARHTIDVTGGPC